MKNRNESALDIFAANSICTRRELVQRFAVVATVAAVPAFITACGGKSSGKASDFKYAISFEVTFSRTMDTKSVEDAISISPAGVNTANAEITWSDSNRVMYYRTGVSSDTTYSVIIAESAADTAGRKLDTNENNTGGEAGDGYTFSVPAV